MWSDLLTGMLAPRSELGGGKGDHEKGILHVKYSCITNRETDIVPLKAISPPGILSGLELVN